MGFGDKKNPQPAAAPAGQTSTQPTTSTATPVDVDALKKHAKSAAQVTAVWVGQSPEEVSPGVAYGDVEVFDAPALLGREILVMGYSLREGENGAFAVVCIVPTESKRVAVFTTGSGPVLRKLKQAGEQRSFPLLGKLAKSQGKRGFAYYDLTA